MFQKSKPGGPFSHQPRAKGFNLTTVTGFVQEAPGNNRDGSDEEEDEDDDDDNWLDYSQMRDAFSSGTFVSMRKAKYCRVGLQDHNGQKHICFGKFLLTDPWWDVTVTIDKNRQVRGPIIYQLRTDNDGIRRHNLVPMLLTQACRRFVKDPKSENEFMEQFEDFIRKTGQVDRLTFEYLDYLLMEFGSRLDPTSKKKTVFKSILSSDIVQSVLRAQSHPELLAFLCELFPYSFLSCLLGAKRKMLTKLQTAAKEEPWIFGFNRILFSRFRLCGVEANLKAFDTAGMLDNIPDTPKDALYIYEVLKQDATRYGHTYISFPDLQNHRHWESLAYRVTDWKTALGFLSENTVTFEERFLSRRNIFLYHNWKSEVDIAEGLKEVMNRGLKAEAAAWRVDFTSEDLERLRGDRHQWSAAQKVAGSPITVLSGKGGCGKTTVVTQIIQHVCQQDTAPIDFPSQESQTFSQILANGELVEITENSGDGWLSKEKGMRDADQQKSSQSGVQLEEKGAIQQATSQNGIRLKRTALTFSQSSPFEANADQKISTDVDACRDLSARLSRFPRPLQMTPEVVSELTGYVTESLQNQHHRSYGINDRATKQRQLYNEVCTDLIKYLATSGDTALSDTTPGSRILLTAPTGKAAKLLGHKAQMRSYTLHHVIFSWRAFLKAQAQKKKAAAQEHVHQEPQQDFESYSQPESQDDEGKDGNAEKKNRDSKDAADDGVWKFADTEVLVVDECSLVSLRLFATLLNILIENTHLRKIILLGDVRQLPSIEPGQFLCDVFSVFEYKGLGVELETNHRSESELIVSNATKISLQQMPFFDPRRNFHFWGLEDCEASADPERDVEIRRLLAIRVELQEHVSSQFVAFRRAHCEAINELCCQHYNNHSIMKAEGSGKKRPYDFQVGDKICFRKNGQILNHGKRLACCLPAEVVEAMGVLSPPKENETQNVTMDASTAARKILESEEGGGEGTESSNKERCVVKNERSQSAYAVHETDFGVKMEDLSQFDGQKAVKAESSGRNVNDGTKGIKVEQQDFDGDIDLEDAAKEGGMSSEGTQSEPESQKKKEDDERHEKLKQGEIRLCNGEVFFIMHVEQDVEPGTGKVRDYLYLSDRDPECPRVYCCQQSQLKRECRMRHAWARTIHTYQGSESDTVVYYVGEPVAQNWKHVYTAVTRGRKTVHILGKESHLKEAISKKDRPRRSRLTNRLTGAIKEVDLQKLHARMREINKNAKEALLTDGLTPSQSSTDNTAVKPDTTLLSAISTSGAVNMSADDFVLAKASTSTPIFKNTAQTKSTPAAVQVHSMPRNCQAADSPRTVQAASTPPRTATACSTPGVPASHIKAELWDSFPDSDDSWVNHMSPYLQLDQLASASTSSGGNTAMVKSEPVDALSNGEAVWCNEKPFSRSELPANTAWQAGSALKVESSDHEQHSEGFIFETAPSDYTGEDKIPEAENLPSPSAGAVSSDKLVPEYKRQHSAEAVNTDVTPTKRSRPDPVDSTLSPVRRTLYNVQL